MLAWRKLSKHFLSATEMSAEELEQIELLEAHDRAWANKLKKQK
jgi:hypothetical protein